MAMALTDATTRIFLIPDHVKNLELFSLKTGSGKLTLAASEDSIFELRELGPSSQFDKRPEPKLQSGEPVKSCIIEPLGSQSGSVVSNPLMISLTKFDMLFPVVKWMSSQSELYTTRYHTAHDILDGFAVCLEDIQQVHLIRSHVYSCLSSFCDEIEENDDLFYKLNQTKLCSHLDNKILKLAKVLSDHPEYALSSQIIESLSSVSGQVPKEILDLQTIKHSVDFLFGSYLNSELMQSYIIYKKYDFSPLDAFIAKKEMDEKARTIAEDNLGVSNSRIQGKGSASNQKSVKASQTKKKSAKKVAVGKGALDNFFKRS